MSVSKELAYYPSKQSCRIVHVVARYDASDHMAFWLQKSTIQKQYKIKNLAAVPAGDGIHMYLFMETPTRLHLHQGNVSLKKICRFTNDCDIVKSKDLPKEALCALSRDSLGQMLFSDANSTWDLAYMKKHFQMKTECQEERNRNMVAKVREVGALNAVESGSVPFALLGHAERLEDKLQGVEDKKQQDEKKLKHGEGFYYLSYKHFEHDESSLRDQKVLIDVTRVLSSTEVEYSDLSTVLDGKVCRKHLYTTMTKQKHIYVQSYPDYGKSTIGDDMLKDLNAARCKSFDNFAGVRTDADFYIIDEFEPKNAPSMVALKSLCGGDASSFAGNRKVAGTNWSPHRDAQFIIFSNLHLFNVMGSYNPKNPKVRKVDPVNAKALRDRFKIYKLDAIETGVTEEMEAEKYIEIPSTKRGIDEDKFDRLCKKLNLNKKDRDQTRRAIGAIEDFNLTVRDAASEYYAAKQD